MATYYIDPGATGTADGLTPINAFTAWGSVTNGNTYLQKRGTVTTARLNISTGFEGNPVIIGAYYNSDGTDDTTQPKPVIDVGGLESYCILGNGSQYVEIENMVFKNATNDGVSLWMSATRDGADSKIVNCEAYDCGNFGFFMGINSGGIDPQPIRENCLIEGCYAQDCGKAGMAIADGQLNCTIRNCTAVRCCLNGNSWGIYMRPRAQAQSSGTWTNVSGNVWALDLVTSGSLENEPVQNVTAAGRHTSGPKSLIAGVYGSVGPNEWATGGTGNNTLQIDIQEDPNSVSVNIVTAQAINCVIENCVSIDTANASGTWDGVGLGLDIGTINGTIRNNLVINSAGAGISSNHAKGTYVYNNVVLNAGEDGVSLPTAIDGPNEVFPVMTIRENRVYNNTFIDSALNGMLVIRTEQLELFNNIFIGGVEAVDDSTAGGFPDNVFNENNNIAHGYSSASGLTGSQSIEADPQLNADYFPAPQGPCIGNGTTLLSTYDFHSRPKVGSGNHIGAKWPKLGGSSVRRKL